MPDLRGLFALLVIGLAAIPLAAWKIGEIIVWFVSHLRWVSP